MRSRALPILLAAALILPPGVAIASETVRAFERDFDGAGMTGLRLDFPIGELTIEGDASDRIHAQVSVECGKRRDLDWCEDRARDIELESRVRDGRLELWLTGYSKWRHRSMHLEMTVTVPERMAVDVDMSIGELELEGLRGDVSVDMSIGEVTLAMRQADVGEIRLDTGIGESSLRTTERRRSSAGLFTRELRWDEGPGEARVRIDLGIGEVSARLR